MPPGRSRSQRNGDASSEEVELEAAENMLCRLQKQYRTMERNRRQYYDETTVLLIKQRKMLQNLEREKGSRDRELKLSAAPKNKSRDLTARNEMSAILERQKHYESLIEDEKEKIKRMDIQITTVEKQLRDVRKTVPSTKLLEAQSEAAKASNTIIENRIQQVTVRLNAILAENSNLRGDIENLLKERDKFMLQARRLEKQLTVTSKRKGAVIDQVTKAYSEREEAQSKMRSLKERIKRDTKKNLNELKKLQRAIDYQTNLRSFVNIIAVGEEEELFRKSQDGDELDDVGIEATLENYRSCIAHLEEESQESSLEVILSNYLQADNDNYTLFSFISDLNNEVTAVSGDVKRLQREIDDIQGRGSRTEKENSDSLGNLREKMVHLGDEVSTLEEQQKKVQETLLSIVSVTLHLFSLFECERTLIHALVGSSEVMSSNLPVFLSVIEQKVMELCHERNSFLQNSDHIETPKRPRNNNEMIPSSGQHSDSDETTAALPDKPAIPHVAHPSEEDNIGPTTHEDILSSLRSK